MAPIVAAQGPRKFKEHPTPAELAAWAAGLEAMHTRIAPQFARREPRERALAWITIAGRGLTAKVRFAKDCGPGHFL